MLRDKSLTLLLTAIVLHGALSVSPLWADEVAAETETSGKDSHGEAPEVLADDHIGAPLRMRDFTFPSFLLLGFAPMPAAPLGKNNYAFELHGSVVNDFQVSAEVEEYLADSRPDGARRPLDAADVAAILALPPGSSFYIDGEFDIIDFNAWWGVTDRLDLGIGFSYIGYTGGSLDGTIFDFHSQFGFGQQGRDLVADHQFQVVLGVGDDGSPTVLLDRPSSGGFSDPSLLFRYALPRFTNGWQFAVSGGAKAPVAKEEDFLSSGGWDFGLQLTFDKRRRYNAFIFNLGLVAPGDFELVDFDPPTLPTAHVTWMRRFKRWESTRFMIQALWAEHPFRDVIDSDLSELELQVTLGFKWNTPLGVFGLGLTENIANYDNTPDIGVHFSWGFLGRFRD